jgi:alpha,alpha-trehalase
MEYTTPFTQYGQLFLDMNASGLWEDDKVIADLIPLSDPAEILKKYLKTKELPGFSLAEFVKDSFKYHSSDVPFESDPSLSIKDHLHNLWPHLTREKDAHIEGSSLIPLPYPYIVPGGRFNEIYYWDSYFTMLGLGVSGQVELIENMIKSFAYLIDHIGFIPNGNRTYFLSRSQPPFFSSMVELLASYKDESVFVAYLPQMMAEYKFWMSGKENLDEENHSDLRVVRVAQGYLNRYYDNDPSPRAEMYATDVKDAKRYPGNAENYYLEVKAACESGWDFSSRWFQDQKTLNSIQTTNLIPVDLNCLLFHLESAIAKGQALAGNKQHSFEYQQKAANRSQLIQKYCWNKENKCFTDYNFETKRTTTTISAAGMFPMYFQVATSDQARKMQETLQKQLLRPGGIVTTNNHTGQQWDAPNGWAPLQWIAIVGLLNYGYPDLANQIKERWTQLCTKVYKNTGKMMEKYNVEELGLRSGGGEYPVQDGFGWSNGVLLKLLEMS